VEVYDARLFLSTSLTYMHISSRIFAHVKTTSQRSSHLPPGPPTSSGRFAQLPTSVKSRGIDWFEDHCNLILPHKNMVQCPNWNHWKKQFKNCPDSQISVVDSSPDSVSRMRWEPEQQAWHGPQPGRRSEVLRDAKGIQGRNIRNRASKNYYDKAWWIFFCLKRRRYAFG